MDFFDNAIIKAKEAFDIACKKTNEVVSTSKQKLDVASIQNKRSKDFEKLGEIYYNLIKDTEIDDVNTAKIVTEIKEKNTKIAELKSEINNAKHKRTCPVCSAAINNDAAFCSVCGAKVTIDE